MTYEYLVKVIKVNNIPKNVKLICNGSWGCEAVDFKNIWYNPSLNVISLTTGIEDIDYIESLDWYLLTEETRFPYVNDPSVRYNWEAERHIKSSL